MRVSPAHPAAVSGQRDCNLYLSRYRRQDPSFLTSGYAYLWLRDSCPAFHPVAHRNGTHHQIRYQPALAEHYGLSCDHPDGITLTLRLNKAHFGLKPDIKFFTNLSAYGFCQRNDIVGSGIFSVDQHQSLLLVNCRAPDAITFQLALIDKPSCCQFDFTIWHQIVWQSRKMRQ